MVGFILCLIVQQGMLRLFLFLCVYQVIYVWQGSENRYCALHGVAMDLGTGFSLDGVV